MRNLIFSIFPVLFSSLIAARAEKLDPGTYYIYNRVLSPIGKKLAITYQGEKNYATVTFLTKSDIQQWVISDYDDKTQAIIPATNNQYEAGWGGDGVIILPQKNYVWTINHTDFAYYTIQDGGLTAYWSLENAIYDSNIIVGKDSGSYTQQWIFEGIA